MAFQNLYNAMQKIYKGPLNYTEVYIATVLEDVWRWVDSQFHWLYCHTRYYSYLAVTSTNGLNQIQCWLFWLVHYSHMIQMQHSNWIGPPVTFLTTTSIEKLWAAFPLQHTAQSSVPISASSFSVSTKLILRTSWHPVCFASSSISICHFFLTVPLLVFIVISLQEQSCYKFLSEQ